MFMRGFRLGSIPIRRAFDGAQGLLCTTPGNSGLSGKPRHFSSPSVFGNDIDLVIFDKDGTLIGFHEMWYWWSEIVGKGISERLGKDVTADVMMRVGYDQKSKQVISGSKICAVPMSEIREDIIEFVKEISDVDEKRATNIVDDSWNEPDPRDRAVPLTDLKRLFAVIKHELGVKIAVCTTDDLAPTEATLKHFGVHDLVDFVLTGDNKSVKAKPSREQIDLICSSLNTSPERCVLVGDTAVDMSMGKSASVAMCIGILHGASSIEAVSKDADVLLDDMNKFEKLFRRIV